MTCNDRPEITAERGQPMGNFEPRYRARNDSETRGGIVSPGLATLVGIGKKHLQPDCRPAKWIDETRKAAVRGRCLTQTTSFAKEKYRTAKRCRQTYKPISRMRRKQKVLCSTLEH
jgi:hypothetical protein